MGSGATVVVLDDMVIKYGDGGGIGRRVGEQGAWLQRRAAPGIVRVTHTWPDGYVMEKLEPGIVACDEILNLLRANVWCNPPDAHVKWDVHLDYVCTRAAKFWPQAIGPVWQRYTSIKDAKLRKCGTHGDPTVENTMLRNHNGWVLIDPIPATPAVPSLMAVDIAKVNQSALGWEQCVRGLRGDVPVARFQHELAALPECERIAVDHFTLVHLIRTLPYLHTKEERDAVIELGQSLLRV